ncbi:histidine--tRNA ligase [Paenibacillus agricola]|uniref:Histidine--tRNA ligase n=1 Tax=Paenibacillus agricola TaxID=2716264 RepID=A0ABX0JDP5_9BACL|nr:histidine--tRNA ligase [Paenibacillus agricola]NHN32021.1 histidine--tRNA ligase [Paenibacillus agricola]
MQNVKGTFDYLGPERALRKQVQEVIETMFELYDFDSMETPILNEMELLASKYAGGEEILKETYQLSDQGNRQLGLRYDLTIPFAKVVAFNPGLEIPFKRYEIGKVFRDGPVKRGRLREFLQCDADVVGTSGPEAEIEFMQLAVQVFKKLDIPIIMAWNNRQFLGQLLARIGVCAEEEQSVMLTLDKLFKIGREGVQLELSSKGLRSEVTQKISELVGKENLTFGGLAQQYNLEQSQGAKEVEALQLLIEQTGLASSCKFDPFLSRGLSFYTGTVYEIFDRTGRFTSSLGGGGRYDAIIGQLVGREDIQYPAVGLSFGMESIMELLKERELPAKTKPVLVLPIGVDLTAQALLIASGLRADGIRIRMGASGRKLKKSLASAAAKGVRFVVLVGSEEAALGQARLKDMQEQTESLMSIEDIILTVRFCTTASN